MASKWLELLKGIAPSIEQVAYVFNPDTAELRELDRSSALLSLRTVAVAVSRIPRRWNVIERIGRQANSGLLVVPVSCVHIKKSLKRSSHSAPRHRLPAVYPFRYFAASGGLMSYGIEVLGTYRQAASYVDRILQGRRP